jgi:hypothetical protein
VDPEESSPSYRWRVSVAERLTKVEGAVARISTDIGRNTDLTEGLYDALRGIRTIAKILVWAAGAIAAIGIVTASMTYLIRQASM